LLALLASSLVYQLLCPPVVGTADNGDYGRVLYQVGLKHVAGIARARFVNVELKYRYTDEQEVAYLTTQVPIVRLALRLNSLLAKDALFDLRMLGATNGLLYLGAVWCLLQAFSRRHWSVRALVGVTALVFFSDVRIVSYFNSFYSESAQVICLIAALACALMTNDVQRSARDRWLSYFAFLALSVAFFLAKTQGLAFVPAFAPIAYAFLPSPHPLRALRLTIALALLCIVPWALLSGAYAETQGRNARVTAREEILAHSPDPARDLVELGVARASEVTLAGIAKFYLRHPTRWWKMARRRARETHRYLELGNFEQPLSGLSRGFDDWSELKRRRYPRHLGWWIAVAVAYGALLVWRGSRRDETREQRNGALLHGALLFGLILQFVAVVTFEANGTEKHFFIFNVLADLLLLFAVLDLASLPSWLRARRHNGGKSQNASTAEVAQSDDPSTRTA
jgi:hypothetical protein